VDDVDDARFPFEQSKDAGAMVGGATILRWIIRGS